ncbi:MAG TPA: hypothetical protein DCY48_02340 [Candidatus Magasanikbacteria bacterium]|nr:MAG: hypothetical protein A3I74_01255 [Candidatus Magasanikbacteria bacterium RIFCSPLOWO2_02_FULL_47_16]OGH79929.1 MAG: hypothetical protein A3C10_01970 [Candidatus Magasanikbacteria bacterium RIFCSPHIGHO2_02_FULL_48_18]OGH83501.1 MAG: hypothetical protein A3G08_01235 [Candidatus Magasanikbacteria bacterium RIFCSPLOWO2_12_FULL_47_9b]HAZ28594.1 hypothetical protein [Candidatus Magasanikbacteria bacterium]
MKKQNTEDFPRQRGWGMVAEDGSEIWDAEPVFAGSFFGFWQKQKLIFYPKKFVLYRAIEKHIRHLQKRYATIEGGNLYIPKILDLGCGTGATVIDFKKMFGRRVDVIGLDIVHLQIDLAQKKMRRYGVWTDVRYFDGRHLPFDNQTIDVVYTSDVLGHVQDVPAWLSEIARVLRPGGLLAMFAESKLGKHAYLRNYFLKHGLNTDPHYAFHVSLFSKATLREMLEQTDFEILAMYSTVWAKFLVHPDELYPALHAQKKFLIFRWINFMLYWLKKITHPVSTALSELYSFVEMLTVGRFIESQGYVIVAKKK